MKKAKRIGITILVIAAVCMTCFFVGRSVGKSAGISKIDSVVLENKLTEISEFASVTYSYTNMAEFENSKDFYGLKLPLTTKGFIVTYDGEIKAGVDLSKAEVKTSGHKVTVTLPEAEILSHEIDEDSLEIFDESTSIFNPLKVADYNSFNKDQKAEMEQKAIDKGMLDTAKEKAAVTVKGFIQQLVDDDWTVEVA